MPEVNKRRRTFFLYEFAYIWQNKRLVVIAKKNEKMRIHFLLNSDVLTAIAAVILWTWGLDEWREKNTSGHRTRTFRGCYLKSLFYTCQLFLRYKREIFVLGVLGFLKTTRSFPKIPKKSEVFRSLPKAGSLPVLFTSKIRDREEGIAIYSFYTWFSFLTWVWVNIFLEIVSSRTATTHIFQLGVRNWPAGVSRRETEVFNPQAWDSRLRRESCRYSVPSDNKRKRPH